MKFAILMIFFLIFEYIADFIAQSRYVAVNKSVKFEVLHEHVMVIMGGVSIGMMIAFSIVWGSLAGIIGGAFFAFFYGIIHGAQDWFIWRFYKYLRKDKCADFAYWNDKLFYDFIGADRTLHIITAVILITIFI